MNKRITNCKRCISGITIVTLVVGGDGKIIYDVDCNSVVGALYVTKSGAGGFFQNIVNRANLSGPALQKICEAVASTAAARWEKLIHDMGLEWPLPGDKICLTFDLGENPVCFQITQDNEEDIADISVISGSLQNARLDEIPCF